MTARWDDGLAIVEFRDERHAVRVSPMPGRLDGDALLPLALPVAMRLGLRLEVVDAVSSTLLENIDAIQRTLANWYPKLLSHVRVDAGTRSPAQPARGVATFFSGGVDSFYTATQCRREVDRLIFVIGFDIGEQDTERRAAATATAERTASALGIDLVEVTTDAKFFAKPYVDWGFVYHGAALAFVAHTLRTKVGYVMVPGTFHERHDFPWGSHPRLDRLWTSDDLRIDQHGQKVTRVDKVRAIANEPVAMNNLRVCWKNVRGTYNCGECEKCLRTMVNLRIVGALDRCATLPHTLDLERVAAIVPTTEGARVRVIENIEAARDAGDAPLIAALERSLRNKPPRQMQRYARALRRRLIPTS